MATASPQHPTTGARRTPRWRRTRTLSPGR